MTAHLQLNELWSRSVDGELDMPEVEAVEAILDVALRAIHLPDEATLGHKVVRTSREHTTVLRIRRDFDAHGTVFDLVTTDPAEQPAEWTHVINDAEAAVAAVERLRAQGDDQPRPIIFVGAGVSTERGNAAWHGSLARLAAEVHDLGFEYAGGLEQLRNADVGKLATADLLIVLDAVADVGLGLELSQVARSGAVVLVLTTNYDTMLERVADLHVLPSSPDRDDWAGVIQWLQLEKPRLDARAKTRQVLFQRIREQLPRARARLAQLQPHDFGSSSLSRHQAFDLLASPATYSSASVAEIAELQRLIGQHSVPKLFFESYSRRRTFFGAELTYEWLRDVAGVELSAEQLGSLLAASSEQGWSPEDVLGVLEMYFSLAERSASVVYRLRLDSARDWRELYHRARPDERP